MINRYPDFLKASKLKNLGLLNFSSCLHNSIGLKIENSSLDKAMKQERMLEHLTIYLFKNHQVFVYTILR